MDIYLVKENIAKLSEQILDLEQRADREGRIFTPEEEAIAAEMQGAIASLEKNLPERPLTLENWVGRPGNYDGGSASRQVISGRKYADMFGRAADRGGFQNFNEFLEVLSSGRFDKRLQNQMTENVPSTGGFVVPEQFAAWLLDASLESELIRPRATIWPMTSDTLKVPGWDSSDHTSSLFGGLTGTWLDEAGSATEVNAKFRQIQLHAKKLACYTSASNELVADGVDFEAQIQMALVKTLSWYMDYSFIQGSGAGQPLGILNDPALVEVSKEVGQDDSTVVYENVIKMYARLAPQCMKNAIWIASQTVVPQVLAMSLGIGLGGAQVQPAVLQEGGRFFLLGKELFFSEKVPTLGSKGQLMLVDPSQYCLGLRREVTLDKSIHVGWSQDLASYRSILRVDGQGQWNAAITPKEGDSLSWCVALAA